MKKLSIVLALMIMSLNFTSCGKKVSNNKSQQLSVANLQLNNKQFEEAVTTLEQSLDQNPNDRETLVKLAHAYAGASGFETIKFSAMIKDTLDMKLNNEARSIIKEISDKLTAIPNLTDVQKTRLEQAISLYDQLNFDPFKTSKENNFKWGTLHTYRLLVTLKEVISTTEEMLSSKDQYTKKELQDYLLSKSQVMAKDFHKSYLLYKNSYSKLQKIALKLDHLIQDKLGSKEFKFKIESKAKTYEGFVKDLIEANKDIIAHSIVKINQELNLFSLNSNVEDIFKDFKENAEDVEERKERLIALTRLFIENVILKNRSTQRELRNIFTKELAQEAKTALKMSVEQENIEPLRDFFQSKNSEVRTITEAFRILNNEYTNSNIEMIAQPDVEALLSYIDKKEIKRLGNDINQTSRNIENIAKDSEGEAKDAVKNFEQRTSNQFDRDSSEIEEDLSDSLVQLNDEIEREDQEMNENASRIVKETKDFVER